MSLSMANVTISVNGRNFSGNPPTKWEEVTPENFLFLAKFFNGDVQDPARRISLFFDLMHLSKKERRRFPVPDENNPQELQLIDTMLQLGQFIQTDAPDKWFIPYVWIGLKKYYAPQPTMDGSTWREFIYVDTLFQQFAAYHSGEFVWQIASVLYRPAGSRRDDIRVPFDADQFNLNSALWKRVNGYISEAIFFNYRIVRSHIAEMYPRLFPKHDETLPESDEPADLSRIVWNDMTDWLCESDPVKKEKYLDGDMHEALHAMEEKLLQK